MSRCASRLFDWVRDQGRPVSRQEASRALRISRPLATFHLDKLADAGLLESGYQRLSGRTGPGPVAPRGCTGRRSREFNVNVPERNYERAAELFATALEAHTGGLPTPLREAAGDLGKNLGQHERARSSTRRLMDALEAGGYEPQVDESGAIRLLNCPFHALVEEHRPLVCAPTWRWRRDHPRAGVTDMVPVLDSQPGYCCVQLPPAQGRLMSRYDACLRAGARQLLTCIPEWIRTAFVLAGIRLRPPSVSAGTWTASVAHPSGCPRSCDLSDGSPWRAARPMNACSPRLTIPSVHSSRSLTAWTQDGRFAGLRRTRSSRLDRRNPCSEYRARAAEVVRGGRFGREQLGS